MVLTKEQLIKIIEEYWRITPHNDFFLLNISNLADKIMEAENKEQKRQTK